MGYLQRYVVWLVLPACAVEGQAPLGHEGAAIVAGSDDLDTPHRNASVFINVPDGSCTGTLISPLRVLTAGHCFPQNTPATAIANGWVITQTDVMVKIGRDSRRFADAIPVGQIFLRQRLDHEPTTDELPTDLAVLALTRRPVLGDGSVTGGPNVLPVHPWEDGASCPRGFRGIYSGWGPPSAAKDAPMPVLRQVGQSDIVAEVIADWPAALSTRSYALTTGLDGALMLSSWSKSEFRIVEISLDRDGLHVARLRSGPGALAMPAVKGADGIVFARAREPVTLETLAPRRAHDAGGGASWPRHDVRHGHCADHDAGAGTSWPRHEVRHGDCADHDDARSSPEELRCAL